MLKPKHQSTISWFQMLMLSCVVHSLIVHYQVEPPSHIMCGYCKVRNTLVSFPDFLGTQLEALVVSCPQSDWFH